MSAPASPTPAPAAGQVCPPPLAPWTRSQVLVLFGFLAVFLALLITFRTVLFPFLMAIFLAYLFEPVVGWASRRKRFGLKWGRAPVLILMYTVVLTGTILLVACGVNRLSVSASQALSDLKTELDKTQPAARLFLQDGAPEPIWVPSGTVLATASAPVQVFKTSFPAQIEKGLKETRVLLRPVTPVDGTLPVAGTPLVLRDAESLAMPTGVELTVKSDKVAKGLEVFTEAHVIAPVAGQIEKLTGDHFDPGVLREFIAEQSEQQGAEVGNRLLSWSKGVLFTIVGSTYQFVLILMLTAFLVIDRRRISDFFASLPPPSRRAQYESLMGYIDRGLAGVIRGQLLICVVNGVLTGVGLHVLGVPYATLLAFVAGVFSLIPVFGTIASSIPIVLVALATGGVTPGIMALAWITLVHLLEANVFNPLIMGSSAEMHPVIIIFALLAGESTFGVWGALLAVPAASLVQACFKYYRHEVLGLPVEAPHGHGAWMRSVIEKFKGRKAAASGPGDHA